MRLFRYVLLASALLAVPATAHADWQRGVDFTTYAASTYGSAASDASLARAAASGNDSTSIVITQYMDTPISSTIRANGATPTYAANWNEYKQVQFWGSLDFIGVDAYYPLSDLPAPTVSQLVSAWTSRGYVDALRASSQQYGKQILFTEIGYRSIIGAAI